jgi:flagella basal body P-ring formation protein FlgA
MRHSSMRWLLLTATFAMAFLGSGAGVSDRPPFLHFSQVHSETLLAEITILSKIEVENKRVSLLDLCDRSNLPEDWKGIFSGVDIGPAPELGTEKYINPEQLTGFIRQVIASRGTNENSVKIVTPKKITVARRGVQVTRDQIEEIYKNFILSKVPWQPEDIAVHLVNCPEPPVLPAGNMTFEVATTPHQRYVGSIGVTINFYVDGKQIRSLQVAGKVDLFQNVVYSRTPLKRDDVITQGDIQQIRTNIANFPDRYATQVDEVVGKRLLSSVGLNQPISLQDLDKPLAVKRGNPVTIIYKNQGLTLTAKGQAKENGSEGDRIRVINVDSKQTVFCQVLNSRTVQIMADAQ